MRKLIEKNFGLKIVKAAFIDISDSEVLVKVYSESKLSPWSGLWAWTIIHCYLTVDKNGKWEYGLNMGKWVPGLDTSGAYAIFHIKFDSN